MPKKKNQVFLNQAGTPMKLVPLQQRAPRPPRRVRQAMAASSSVPRAPPPPIWPPPRAVLQQQKKKLVTGVKQSLLAQLAKETGLAGLVKWSGLNAESTGAALGGYLGGAPGRMLGRKAGKVFRTVTGMGAYHYAPGLRDNEVPSFGDKTVEDGSMVMCKREFVLPVILPAPGGTIHSYDYIVRELQINPGNAILFPWLNSIAANFEEWEPLGMIFQYVTLSSPINNSNTGGVGLGSVAGVVDYDAYDTAPPSKQFLLQMFKVEEDRPSNPIRCEVECKKSMNTKSSYYIRTVPDPPGDLREYDMGKFFFITEGIPEASGPQYIGDLYVSLKVKFRKPILTLSQIPTPGGVLYPTTKFSFSGTNLTASKIFGNTIDFTFLPNNRFGGYLDGSLVTTPTPGGIPGLAVLMNSANAGGGTTNVLSLWNTSPSNMVLIISYQARGSSTTLTNTLAISSLGPNLTSFNLFSGVDRFSNGNGAVSTCANITICLTLIPDATSGHWTNGAIVYSTGHTMPTGPSGAALQIVRIG